MKTKISFIKNFFKNRKEVGSIVPSSPYLAKEMVKKEDIEKSEVILEIWAWTGIFTEELLKHNIDWKKIIIIEKNKEFYDILRREFSNLIIINDDILNLEQILKKHNIEKIDLIISGIPFRSLPDDVFHNFIKKLSIYIDKDSKFIQFSYFKDTKNKLELYFDSIFIKKVLLNIPFAYIFTCSNIKK